MASPAPIRAPKSSPLQRGDWIQAAFARLAQDGIDAVRVEVLARELHVSKGSFYWHFRDRDELAAAMLDQWEENEEAWLAEAALEERSAAARWAELVKHLTDAAHSRLEAALRDWARRDERVAARARAIEAHRRGFIAAVLRDVGFATRAAEAWSELALVICLGWVERATRDAEFRGAPKRGLGDFLSELVLAASARSGGGRG
ncbi:MAG: helix-turn-helix domain-containing protein [Candidatus Acidiferrales bacterium]